MASSRIIGGIVGWGVIVAVAAFAIAWRPALVASEPPQSFDPALVKRGCDVSPLL